MVKREKGGTVYTYTACTLCADQACSVHERELIRVCVAGLLTGDCFALVEASDCRVDFIRRPHLWGLGGDLDGVRAEEAQDKPAHVF